MNKNITASEAHLLAVNDRQIPLRIHYESRSNSRVSITKKGVILRISRYLNRLERERQIQEFKQWALKKFQQRPELCIPPRKDFYSGKVIAVRDQSFVLQIEFTDAKTSIARLNGSIIAISLSTLLTEEQMEKAASTLISKCVAQAMHPWVVVRLHYWNDRYFPQRKFKTLRLKYTNTLWGSCSHDGNISISTRLLLAPDFVIDYVLVHELAHLIVPNHSQKFWSVVAQAYPGFEAGEKWLKKNGKQCDF